MIVFFVVDRPVSLEILKGFFAFLPKQRFGLLTHAFVSKTFVRKFREFPFGTELKYVDIGILEKYSDNDLLRRVIKMVDSGIFYNKKITYSELFERYENLGAGYGVIIDFLNDKNKTIKSAHMAMKEYSKGNYSFNLVGVAQGRNLEEYMECYKSLQDIGYKYIALGGLLRRNGSSNYLNLKSEEFLKNLMEEIGKRFKSDWIFAFGIFHSKRKKLLEELRIWGADYKGWLFQYNEDYSFVEEYLKSIEKESQKTTRLLFAQTVLNSYKTLKSNYKLSYSSEEEKRIIKSERRLLDKSLRRLNLSLQMLRFIKIRENLATIFKS